MASIKISDLRPSGLDLFVDSESFLNDLSDSDLANTNGGATPVAITLLGAAWLGYSIGKEVASFF
jgi:hypothetical protein